MAKSAKGKGSDYGHGSAKATRSAPQPTKRASYKGTQSKTGKAARPR